MLRRRFLLQFCQGAGASLIPSQLWNLPFSRSLVAQAPTEFSVHPHYRSERPLDRTLLKVDAALDRFVAERYADQVSSILTAWSDNLLRTPATMDAIEKTLSHDFSGVSPKPASSQRVRSDATLTVDQNRYADSPQRDARSFIKDLRTEFAAFSKIDVAEFQITSIKLADASSPPSQITTVIRFELAGSGSGFHREQLIGNWELTWVPRAQNEFEVTQWRVLDESRARANSPIFVDSTVTAFAGCTSYREQLVRGTDYWRTVLDGACGIDVYGHNGVSVADIDNDGFDDLYICQPAGLPNRLYRNRGDSTFEDITESSGLGILDNTACALFADFNNDGLQDAVIVRITGPTLYLNQGGGKFREQPDAFHFTNPPQGNFTGAAIADYDRDGWLDIYFCLYTYYQAAGQYKYPLPYHDAQNGPANFLMRNNRDGTFRDVTTPSGLNKNNTRYSFCCAWNDFNRDGWPDLYVVNDFGRKNLYRNNGDGTFTDVAPDTHAEDIGAGMSVSWLDYNNDGAPDLYVGNMWTAAGMRIAQFDDFKKDSSPDVRALYNKHAMGNSLLQNHSGTFSDVTQSSATGMGRWAWSGDAFDFDHDGYPDLYVTNGMVSGPQRNDLNSFFWRQVVANSPDDAVPSHPYEQGWNAINELIRSDGTWSGYERNVFYANNRDGSFSDISAVAGLDFIEDGRSFALADFDHDGRLEILLKNRNAPQVRLLKNVIEHLPPSISFRLEGTKSNRDAIGAVITIETPSGRQSRSLQAGSGFLAQHSKDIFFGLGNAGAPIHASIHWPSGVVQELKDLPLNHRVWVKEGSAPTHVEPFLRTSKATHAEPAAAEALPAQVETWLLAPLRPAEFSLPDQSGQQRSLAALKGKPLLLNFSTNKTQPCLDNLRTLSAGYPRWKSQGLELIAINVDTDAANSLPTIPFPLLHASDDVTAIYNLLYRQIFDRHRDMTLPTSFLIDRNGLIVKVYQGSVDPAHLENDFQSIPRTDADRLQRALPFPSTRHSLEFGRNYLSLGSLFFQRGYLDQAEVFFQQALHDDPSSAEALYGIGSVYLNQNKNVAAREAFERCVKLQANYPDTLPDAWNNLGVLATRENRMADSIANFQQALKLAPHHLLSLDNLGNAYRMQKGWDDARTVLQSAFQIAPDDPETNYSLGMVFAQTGDTDRAYEHLQLALKARPNYPEALNNLGILYLLTHRRDQAVASFQQCIRLAPAFDQAYLNLARLYALEGARDRARSLLQDLLKQHPDHQQARQMLDQLQ